MNSTRERTGTARPVRSRPRWAVPVVVAAALLVAGAGTALAAQASRHNPPPSRAAGQAAPIGVTWTSPRASAPAAVGGGRPGAPGASASASAAGPITAPGLGDGTTLVRVGGLTLRVPAHWTVFNRGTVSGRVSTCLSSDRAGRHGCELLVTALTDGQVGPVSVDTYASLLPAEPPTCVVEYPDGTPDVTTAYEVRTVGGRNADYRAYTKTCDRAYHYEQWTVPTWPPVQLTTTDEQPEAAAQVRAIVASARFDAPDSGRRVMDNGLLVGHGSDSAGGLHITLDRTIWLLGGADNGHDENSARTTYDYRVAAGVKITDEGLELCGAATRSAMTTCPLSTVLSRIDKGQARGIVQLEFDHDGVVVGIHGEYRP